MSDIVLEGNDQVTVQCENLTVEGHDLILNSTARRTANGKPYRRALVHDQADGLSINFNGDYPGGVSVYGTLKALGDIEFHIKHNNYRLQSGGFAPDEVVTLSSVVSTLRGDILALQNAVASIKAGK